MKKLVFLMICLWAAASPVGAWNHEVERSDAGGGTYKFQYTDESFGYRGKTLSYTDVMDFKTERSVDLTTGRSVWQFKFRILFNGIAKLGQTELNRTQVSGEAYLVLEDGQSIKIFNYTKAYNQTEEMFWGIDSDEYGECRFYPNQAMDADGYVTLLYIPSKETFAQRAKAIQFKNRLTYNNKAVYDFFQYEKALDISSYGAEILPNLQFKGWQADGSILLGADGIKVVAEGSDWARQRYFYDMDYDGAWGDSREVSLYATVSSFVTKSAVKNGMYDITFAHECLTKERCTILPFTMPVVVRPKLNLIYHYQYSDQRFNNIERPAFLVTPYTRPETVTPEFDKWTQKVKVKWTRREKASYGGFTADCKTDGRWYLLRYEKGSDPDDYKLIGDIKGNSAKLEITDEDVAYDHDYVYRVVFLPDILEDAYSSKLTKLPRREGAHTPYDLYEEQTVSTAFDVPIQLSQDRSDDSGVHLMWDYNILARGCEWRLDYRRVGSDTWQKVTTIPIDPEQSQASYVAEGSVCDFIDYRLTTTINGKEFYSNTLTANLPAGSYISEVKATAGTEDKFVMVKWKVARPDPSHDIFFHVLRRPIGTDEWTRLTADGEIYGTKTDYSYKDERVMAGSYYEYTVEAYGAECEDQLVRTDAQTAPGFSQARGTITGHIAYGTGTAVAGARVKLLKSSVDESGEQPQFLSRYIEGEGKGLQWTADKNQYQNNLNGKQGLTLQLWAKPLMDEGDQQYSLLSLADVLELGVLNFGDSLHLFAIDKSNGGGSIADFSNLVFDANDFTHVSAVYASGTWTFYVGTDTLRKATMSVANPSWDVFATESTAPTLAIAGSTRSIGSAFKGNIDDVRVWTRALTQKDVENCYTRILGGTEKGLIMYWPMDEGLNVTNYVFDVACQGGIYQQNHAVVGVNARPSEQVPELLSLYGLTDAEGDYIIRGIQFQQGGTNYKITPQLGIHEFSPNSRSMFVSPTSLTANNIDFEDVSSFPMEGYVYYAGTNIPAEGIELYVDGDLLSAAGEVKMTDANGYYSISVPIGKHYVEAKLKGHKMVDGGRFPVSGEFNFDRAIQHDFADSTLVNLVGRINGSERNDTLGVGFGASKNYIGMATLTLKLNNESLSFNCQDDHISPAAARRTWESDTTSIQSQAWTGTGSDSRYIYIRTDSLTGEFSALLPPLKYIAKGITVNSNPDIEFPTLPEIDLTNVLQEGQMTDSLLTLNENGQQTWKYYHYNTKYVRTYYAPPQLKVLQTSINGNTDAPQGVFGRHSIKNYEDEFGKFDIDDLWQADAGGTITYRFGYPILRTLDKVTMQIFGYETYINRDNPERVVTTAEPLSGQLLTINNEMSSEQLVITNLTEEGTGYEVGDVYEIKSNELTLDAEGKGEITWTAGMPNVIAPYTRQFNINYKRNERTYFWNDLNAIILGNISTGNNFVTLGPDIPTMVLRNPPGANSSTTWKTGKTNTKLKYDYDVAYGDEKATVDLSWGFKTLTFFGIGVSEGTKWENTTGGTFGYHVQWQNGEENTQTWSTTTTEAVSTNARNLFTIDGTAYASNKGDVFIGASTNIIIGDCRKLGFFRESATSPVVLDVRDATSIGDSIASTFMYSAFEVEHVMMPKWKETRNNQLKFVESKEAAESYVNTGDRSVYVTWLPRDSEALKADSLIDYVQIAPANMKAGEFCEDSIQWCNSQISRWKSILAKNEADKVEAMKDSKFFKRNISFDGETTYTYTERNDTTSTKKDIDNWKMGGIFSPHHASEVSAKVHFALSVHVDTENGRIHNESDNSKEDQWSKYAELTYLMKDGNLGTDFSVNIYKSPAGWSDIFSVLGGQSYNPHEDEEYAIFFEPEKKHKLQNGTERMEQPVIRISTDGNESSETATLTDVPAGQAGHFTLHLTNNTTTNQSFTFGYSLVVVEDRNNRGLQINLDGTSLSNGRTIYVPAGSTIQKVITVKQTDISRLDYEDVRMRFISLYQPMVIYDEVSFNVHFKPSSSAIDLVVNEPVVNCDTPNGTLDLKLTNFNRQFKNLENIGVEYRYQGNTQWTALHTYVTDPKAASGTGISLLPASGDVRLSLDMSSDILYPDGTYTFRAFTTTPYDSERIRVYSDEVTVVKDRVKPTFLTTPTPTNGILTYGDDLSVEFNEDIVPGYVGDKNIIVTARLNQQPVTHEVSKNVKSHNGDQRTANPIFLSGDFSVDFWLYLQGGSGGSILQLGKGQNTFTLGVDDEQHVVVTIAGRKLVSEERISNNVWTYVVLSYNSEDNTLSGLAQADASSFTLFDKQTVSYTDAQAVSYSDDNYLYLGNLSAYIHDLSLFNIYRDVNEAAATRYQEKDGYVRGLTNYWPMNEGSGSVAADMRHTHDFQVTNEWWINNYNQSLVFDDDKGVEASIAQYNTNPGDSYALELWAKVTGSATEQTLFETGTDDSNRLRLYFDANDDLRLQYGERNQTVASHADFPDHDEWVHYALNVVRGQAASFYRNGARTAVIAETHMPPVVGAALRMGQGMAQLSQLDEVRFWHASLSEGRMMANMYNMIDTADIYSRGLVAYYPFEKPDPQSPRGYTLPTFENMAPNATGSDAVHGDAACDIIEIGAPLHSAPQEVRITASPVASERKVVVNLKGATVTARELEGTTLKITLADIHDQHGNTSQPILWTAYVQQNTLKWARDSVNVIKQYGDGYTFDVDIENQSGTTEYYTLYNMPQWLSLVGSTPTDDISPLKTKTLRFAVNPLVPVGNYDVTIGLQGNKEILEPLRIVMKVRGEKPDWAVDPTKYDHQMSIVGQVYINGILMENAESMVAAFIGNECRGVASPTKVRGAAYVTMTVYGDDTKAKDRNKPVTFRIWDASRGVAYTEAQLAVNGTATNVTFQQDRMLGSFDAPAIWTKSDKMEQLIPVHENWNWMAFGVEPESTYLDLIFSDLADWKLLIKNRTAFSDYNGAEWNGTLVPRVNEMYKLKIEHLPNTLLSTLNSHLSISGRQPKPEELPVTLNKGWNWIAYTPLATMTVGEALAAANPQKGDIVKSQTGMSIYGIYGWEGNLQALESGHGYMYYSTDATAKSFVYPDAPSASARKAAPRRAPEALQIFTPVDKYLYPNNMTMAIQLKDGTAVVDTAEVAAFVGDECRGASRANSNGLYYLVIAGEGAGQPIILRTYIDGEVIDIDDTQQFVSDANIGTSWEPYVIDLLNPSVGVTKVTIDDATDDDDWWTLQGIKLTQRPTQPGVYIHRGKKITVRRNDSTTAFSLKKDK